MSGVVGLELTDELAEPPRLIPCLLLEGDRLVKTTRFRDPVYVGDPVNVLSIFNTFEVDEIVLLDVGAARSRHPRQVERLRHYAEECFIPLAYGGGLSTLSQIEAVLGAGYEKVILNTILVEQPGMVRDASRVFGAQAVVGSIDVRGGLAGSVQASGASIDVASDVIDWVRRVEDLGVGEILVTSVDREGTMGGFDLELVRAAAGAVGVPVIAHGGAGRRRHLAGPIGAGASAVAAGSLFVFQGASRGVLINYPARAQLAQLMAP